MRAFGKHALKINIARNFSLLIPVDSHVYNNRALFYHVAFYEFTASYGNYQNLRLAGEMREIFCAQMANRNRGVPVEQHRGDRLAHYVAPAHHHNVHSLNVDAEPVNNLHNSVGSA